MEIDHIYICTEVGAPVAGILSGIGLSEGSSNTHPGQGTASRRFFFKNFMLEFLWMENEEEALSERTKPMRLHERCVSERKSSPFGIGLRPAAGSGKEPPFTTWDYHPVYLPDHLKIQVAERTSLNEPMYFFLPFAKRPDTVRPEKREPMEHLPAIHELTSVKVTVLSDVPLSEAAGILNDATDISICRGNEHLLELTFDRGARDQFRDFRPELPLIFRW